MANKKSINEARKELRFQAKVHEVGPVFVDTVEQEVVNGRIVNKAVRKEVDYTKQFEGLKVSDFYLENLIAVGSLGSLNDVVLEGDKISNIDSIVSSLEKINIEDE